MSVVAQLLDLRDPANTSRKRLLTRLACFADEDLQRRLRSGESVNGQIDLADLFDAWEDDPRELARMDATIGAEELQGLIEFDDFLRVHYWSQSGFKETEAWDWLFDLRLPPPEIWRETVLLAHRTLDRFPDFDLSRWRAAGHPIW